MSNHIFWVRRRTEQITSALTIYILAGVAMSCVIGRGYFEELGRFGSRVYKNNELSQVLREDNPYNLKSAIGLMFVLFLLYRLGLTHITVIHIEVMSAFEQLRVFWTLPRPPVQSMRTRKGFPRSISRSISQALSSIG